MYSATVRRLLISCPGDVSPGDLAIVHKAINRWNGMYGHQFAAVIIPISWSSHAAAEFGRHPQEILNDQLVDSCDMCLAIFANRLGTQTLTAESGTVDEIERLHAAGKYVGILRSIREVKTDTISLDQVRRLEKYLSMIKNKALVIPYSSEAELENHVSTILLNAISRDQARAQMQIEAGHRVESGVPGVLRHAEVWPRVEAGERISTESQGRFRTSRNWYLVLSNTGNASARDVRCELQNSSNEGEIWSVVGASKVGEVPYVEAIAPKGDIRFAIIVTFVSAIQVRCVVHWMDDRGQQENVATLRLN